MGTLMTRIGLIKTDHIRYHPFYLPAGRQVRVISVPIKKSALIRLISVISVPINYEQDKANYRRHPATGDPPTLFQC
jgi:hypothetical protein